MSGSNNNNNNMIESSNNSNSVNTPFENKELNGSKSTQRPIVQTNLNDEIDVVNRLINASVARDSQSGVKVDDLWTMAHLTKTYQAPERRERYKIMKKLFRCKMAEVSSLQDHALRMKGYLDQLDRFGESLGQEFARDIVLNSLPSSYGSSIMNYNLNGWDKTIFELFQILETIENNGTGISTPPASESSEVLSDQKGRVGRPNHERKALEIVLALPAFNTESNGNPESDVSLTDSYCFHCNGMGHWNGDCSDHSSENTSGAKEK